MYSRLGLCLPIVWLISLVSYQHSSVNAAKILTAPDIDATVANGDNEESDNTDLIFDTDESSDPRTYNNMPVPLVPIGDEQNNFLQSYGVWCGGNHGGFQDCCGGQPCPNCKIKHGVVPASLLTPECLAECPPTDILDHACAWHDACTFSHDRPLNFTCSPQGNECFCDCTLVRTTYNLTCPSYSCTAYRAALDELFLHGTACYVKDENGTMTCEGLRSGIGLYTHCDKGEPVFGNTTANVIPENGSGPGKRRLHGRIVGDETRGATGNGNEIDNEIGLGDEKEGVAVEENAEGLY